MVDRLVAVDDANYRLPAPVLDATVDSVENDGAVAGFVANPVSPTAVAVATVAKAATLVGQSVDLANRVPNSALADVTSGLAAGWVRSGASTYINAVSIAELPGVSWKLDGAGSQIGVYSAWFDVIAGEQFTYAFTYRGSLVGTTTGVARIEWRNAADTSAGTFSTNLTLPGAANATGSFVVTAPATAVRARVFMLHGSSATSGSWYVNSIEVRRRVAGAEVLGPLRFPGGVATTGDTRVVTNTDSSGIEGNFYGAGYTTPAGVGFSQGTRATPVPDARPVVWAQKFSSSNRTTNPSEWDQGAGYFAMEKRSGDAYAAGLTGYARHESVDGGDAIGVHGRASAYKAASKVWGGWFYAHAGDPATVPISIIGIEINLNSRIPDQGYTPALGYSKGLLVVTQDSSLPVSMGIEVGRGTAAPNGHFHTGIKIRKDSMLPSGANSSSVITDNEAVLIEGSTLVADAANGIRFGFGNYRTGITFSEATIADNAAIVLGEGHRIVVGPGASVTSYAEFSRTGSYLNLSNLNLRVNGTKVVGARKTGWGTPTGTATRTAFDPSTVTLQGLAERFAALLIDLKPTTGHGLID